MAAAVRTRATIDARTTNTTGKGCPCTDEGQLTATLFRVDALRGEFELPTAGDVEWLLFSYTSAYIDTRTSFGSAVW